MNELFALGTSSSCHIVAIKRAEVVRIIPLDTTARLRCQGLGTEMPYLLTKRTYSDTIPRTTANSAESDAAVASVVVRIGEYRDRRFPPVEQLLSRCDELTRQYVVS